LDQRHTILGAYHDIPWFYAQGTAHRLSRLYLFDSQRAVGLEEAGEHFVAKMRAGSRNALA
jgi:hypothetical protein